MNFDFFTAGKIIFGSGSLGKIGTIAPSLGSNFIIVSGGTSMARSGVLGRIERQLVEESISFIHYKGIVEEPEPEIVEAGVALARENHCDAVIAIGGGSVLDTGKAIAALITNPGYLMDYLEGVGKGRKLIKDPVPCIAIPTTAGTGSEVTKNAVITSKSMKFKKSLRHEKLTPDVALVDPLLSLTLPPQQTAYSGMDAITQLIEAYVSLKANPVTDLLCLYGIEIGGRFLKKAYLEGSDLTARENMALTALISGICLANAGLGAAHGIAAALGCYYGLPHGLACSILLPHVMERNMEANIEKFAHIGKALTGNTPMNDREAACAGIQFIKELNTAMNIPADLQGYNIAATDLPLLAGASRGNSMNGNPISLKDEEIITLLSVLI